MYPPLLSCLTHAPAIALTLLLKSIAPSFNLTRNCRIEADSLQRVGWQHYEQSCWLKAEQTFQQVFVLRQAIDDGVGMTETLIILGSTAYQQHKFAQAVDYCRQAFRISQAANYLLGMGISASHIGWIYHQLGRWSLALCAYQHALKVYVKTDDYGAVGQTLQMLGTIYADSGRSQQAQHYQQLAATILQESTAPFQGSGATEAIALQNLNLISNEQPSPVQLDLLPTHPIEVLERYQSLEELHQEAIALHTVATLYQRDGLYLSALAHEKQALALFQLLGDSSETDQICYNLGRIHERLGHQKTAMRFYGQVLGNLLKVLPDIETAHP